MVDYVKLQNTANNLITKFGKAWVLRRETKGTYNPSTNARTTSATTNYDVKAVLSDYVERQIDGVAVLRGDKLLTMSALSLVITPTLSDLMVDGTDIWKIINIEIAKPSDTVLYYKLQVRQ